MRRNQVQTRTEGGSVVYREDVHGKYSPSSATRDVIPARVEPSTGAFGAATVRFCNNSPAVRGGGVVRTDL